MQCPFCRMTLTSGNDLCTNCGKNVPDGLETDAMSEVAELKDMLARTRERLSDNLRSLEQRLNQHFQEMGEKLESLESSLRDTTVVEPEIVPEEVPAPQIDTSSMPAATEPPPLPTIQPAPPAAAGPGVAARRPHMIQPPPLPTVTPNPADRMAELANAVRANRRGDAKPKGKPADGMAELRFGQKWLLIAGVVIMVLGLGYFLKYSFDQNWIGPAGRVALAYFAGIACLGAGELFRRKEMYRGFGFALMGGGIAILYFSGFAAFQIYGLISQPVAFGLLVLVTAVAGTLSYVHNAQWMAILGLIGGFATPIILSTGSANQIVLMTYMAVLNLAVLALARLRTWRLLTTLAFGFTWLLFAGWFFKHYVEEKFWITTFFLNLFYVIHFLAPVAYHLRRESQITVFGFATALPNAFIAFGFSHYIISRHASVEYVGIVTLVYALMAIALAAWLHRRRIADRRPFVMLLMQGLLFLGITVPVVFSQHWITVFWAVQAATLVWAARRLDGIGTGRQNAGLWVAGGGCVLLVLALGKLFLYDYVKVFGLNAEVVYQSGFAAKAVERWLTFGVSLAALPAVTVWLPASWRRKDRQTLWGLFAILLFVSLNLETAACFGDYAPKARFAALSVLWGLYAVTLLVLGFLRNSSLLRKAGIGLFGFTIAKVFLVDMAHISTPFRIISFVVLGVLLIGASFLYYYYRDRLLRAIATKEAPPASGEPTAEEEKNSP